MYIDRLSYINTNESRSMNIKAGRCSRAIIKTFIIMLEALYCGVLCVAFQWLADNLRLSAF